MQLPTELDGAFMLWDTGRKPAMNIDIQMLHRSQIMQSHQKTFTKVFESLLRSPRLHLIKNTILITI